MSIVHIPFYPSDWLAGTAALSDAEKGVYITLVARMYEMAGPIERDDNRLYRVCGSKSKASFIKALEYLISEGKIIVTSEGLFNEKASKVIEQTTEKSTKARSAAQSRWDRKPNKNNGGDDADAPPKHMPEQCQPEPEPELKKETKVSSSQEAEGYQDYLKAHPNPIDSDAGADRFSALVEDGVEPDQIIGAARRYAEAVAKWSSEAKVQQSDNFICPGRGKWDQFIPKSKPTPVPQSSQADILAYHASKINGDGYVAPNTINTTTARALIEAGLVTPQKLKERGIAA